MSCTLLHFSLDVETSTIQISLSDPTTVVLLLSLCTFFLTWKNYPSEKGLNLCYSPLWTLYLESRLRSQRRYSSWALEPFRNNRRIFHAPPWDLTAHRTLWILHRELWSSVSPMRTFSQTKQGVSLHGTCPPAFPHHYAFLQISQVLGLMSSFDSSEGPIPS